MNCHSTVHEPLLQLLTRLWLLEGTDQMHLQQESQQSTYNQQNTIKQYTSTMDRTTKLNAVCCFYIPFFLQHLDCLNCRKCPWCLRWFGKPKTLLVLTRRAPTAAWCLDTLTFLRQLHLGTINNNMNSSCSDMKLSQAWNQGQMAGNCQLSAWSGSRPTGVNSIKLNMWYVSISLCSMLADL